MQFFSVSISRVLVVENNKAYSVSNVEVAFSPLLWRILIFLFDINNYFFLSLRLDLLNTYKDMFLLFVLLTTNVTTFSHFRPAFFKGCVRYFLSNFYFLPDDSLSKTMKNVLFHLKSYFCSQDIQVFVFFAFPFFFSC